MPTRLMINVTNRSPSTESFYLFQQPAIFGGGFPVYNNCLASERLGSYDQTGSMLTFELDAQPYASIQQASHSPQVGYPSGHSIASRAIDLTSPGRPSRNTTTASIRPLGLTQPETRDGVQPGAFRIATPSYSPVEIYNIGSAVQVYGRPMLSSFVQAMPAYNVDCQPILKFYVHRGNYAAGSVINFTVSSIQAAICDFSHGHSVINVMFNRDGTWSTQIAQ